MLPPILEKPLDRALLIADPFETLTNQAGYKILETRTDIKTGKVLYSRRALDVGIEGYPTKFVEEGEDPQRGS